MLLRVAWWSAISLISQRKRSLVGLGSFCVEFVLYVLPVFPTGTWLPPVVVCL